MIPRKELPLQIKSTINLILLTITLISTSQLLSFPSCRAECPQEDLIEPCSCSHIDFRCDKPNLNSSRLAEIFRVKSIGRKAIRQLYIHSTNLTELRAKQFGDFKIGRIYLDHNKIRQVESGSFSSSYETLSDLSMSANGLVKFPWGDLKHMRKLDRLFLLNNTLYFQASSSWYKIESKSLKELNLGLNQLSVYELKQKLFERLSSLEILILRGNAFESIPSESLYINSKNRVNIDLSDNSIKNIDPNAFGSNKPKHLDLSRNELRSFNQTIFKPLLIAGSKIDVTENPIDCTDCDTHKWILDDKSEDWMSNLIGFRCHDGTTLKDLTHELFGCTNN